MGISYFTDDLGFAVALLIVYGEESLVSIEMDDETGKAVFSLAIPSVDTQQLRDGFDSADGLAIANSRTPHARLRDCKP